MSRDARVSRKSETINFHQAKGDEKMDDNREQEGVGATTAQYPKVEMSPGVKLSDEHPLASPVPGAQSAESDEVKSEVNPNTE